jgi:transcription-repair coupling factor (superfamily II helicase)
MTPDTSDHIKRLAALLSPSDAEVTLAGLKGSAPAYLLSRIFTAVPGTFLIVTPDTESAEETCRELRFFTADPDAVLYFPSWDQAPIEQTSPHPEVVGRRLNVLFRLTSGDVRAVVAPISALIQKVLPRHVLGEVSQYLVTGEEADREELLAKLVRLGYASVPLVEDPATFSVRGGILDIFTPNLPLPVRIEFFGDFVETIRAFDPVSQRSLHPLPELIILPSREMLLPGESSEFAGRLKKRCDDLGISAGRRRELLERLQNAIFPPGIEYLQPLFHPDLETIFAYTGPDTVVTLIDPAAIAAAETSFRGELATAEQRALEEERIFCAGDELFLSGEALQQQISRQRLLLIPALELLEEGTGKDVVRFAVDDNRDLKMDLSPDSEAVLKPIAGKIFAWLGDKYRVICACHQLGQAERLHELLSHYALPLAVSEQEFPAARGRRDSRVEIITGEISRGFRLRDEGLVVIAEEEIFGRRVKRRGISEARKKQILTSLAELKPGDPMVHLDFGVGIYRGLHHVSLQGGEGDFLLLEYAGSDKLYLPVDRINLVQRYIGAEGAEPRVDRLGGAAWDKAKAKAREAVQEMAAELLKIYASRQVHDGFAFAPPDDLFREFEAAFAFEETPDQMSAIEDVLRDMESAKPMDRLVCGDVGYGKTEVAMRAAFKAVMDGKQVAVLVPTTVLAQQHLETFGARFSAYPVKVEMLSRFRSPKEQKAILEGVKKGDVDIIIGTHRLIQKDVAFKDLGLLIIDEEQRFGVTHKERLKQFRAVVDIMTLTATPIPRTLYMSIMGIRDLSIIDTPPVDRLAIKTFVARFSDELIREAIMREIRRGGQVFFVHNRVQSIGAMAEHLQRIVPEARIAVGHGQMEEGALEKVMLSFMHGETNLLLCTTIIESGLDIPNANTLFVNRADAFGLAQLYQLRGRVGRSRQRAYAYFLIPGEGAITADARERLKILQDISELGAGFRIATHDLEIRGAGDLLGARQTGNITAVGFELYTEMLEETVRQLKGEKVPERVEPEIKLHIPAFIPEDYVKEPNQRLVIYKKLSQVDEDGEIAGIRDELIDRYGKLPLAAIYLLEVMEIRLRMKKFLIREAEFDGKRVTLSFHPGTPVSPDLIIALIRKEPRKYQFTPDYRLVAEVKDTSFDGVLEETRNVLKRLV